MAKATVPVKKEVIEWARKSIPLTEQEAAEAIKVDLETLRAWEQGTDAPGLGELRRMAQAYRRTLVTLLLPGIPPEPNAPPEFRTVEGIGPDLSLSAIVAVRDAQRIAMIAADLLEDDPDLFPAASLKSYDTTANPYHVGAAERQEFGVPASDPVSWPSPNAAYNQWRALLQFRGILTLAKQMDREDCRGFSLPEPIPVVVVNSREVDQAKIFTLFHEYGHLLLGTGGICLERDDINVEWWCNRFAASFLVPAERLKDEVYGRQVTDTAEVERVAGRLKVSRHCIALRLMEIGLATQNLYEAIKEEDRGRDFDKPPLDEDEEFKGRAQEAVRLSEVGFGFANLVLSAMDKGTIGAGEAADFLDVRGEKLDPLAKSAAATVERYGG